MDESSARYGLPFIMPGQAQKELFHNEALAALDLGLHPAVESAPSASPPLTPAVGGCWLVAEAATGAWAGKDGAIAGWTSSGWRFVAPQPGMLVWDKAASVHRRWTGSGWTSGEVAASALHVGGIRVVSGRQPTIAVPSGGSTIDAEARSAIAALIVSLQSHGLIE